MSEQINTVEELDELLPLTVILKAIPAMAAAIREVLALADEIESWKVDPFRGLAYEASAELIRASISKHLDIGGEK